MSGVSDGEPWRSYASAVLRSVGAAEARQVAPPQSLTHLRARVASQLDAVEPQAGAPSLGRAVRDLVEQTGRAAPDRDRVRRGLVELKDLFAHASFRRTKRAERGWLLAQLLVLFALEPAVGLVPKADDDDAAHLKRVRRALREP